MESGVVSSLPFLYHALGENIVFKKTSLQARLILMIGLGSLIVMAAVSFTAYFTVSPLLQNRIELHMKAEAHNMVHQIDTIYSRIAQIPVTVAASQAKGYSGDDFEIEIKQALASVLKSDPDILSAYVAFEPGAYRKKPYALFGYRYNRDRTAIEPIYINAPGIAGYDSAKPVYEYHQDESWYALAKREGHFVWGPPYYDAGGMEQNIVSAVAPIIVDGKFVGVAGVDMSLESMSVMIKDFKIGNSGYGMVFTQDTRYLAHPTNSEAIQNGETLAAVAEKTGSADLKYIIEQVNAGKETSIQMNDPITGERNWYFSTPIQSTGWWLAVTVPESELVSDVGKVRNATLFVTLGGIAVMALLSYGIARSISQPVKGMAADARELSLGNLDALEQTAGQRAKLSSRGDELGEMGRAFDGLVDYLRNMAGAANSIAGGDLTIAVDPRSAGDRFGNAFVQMIERLKGLVGQVADSAAGLSGASSQLAATAMQSGQAAGQIAATINQVARGTSQQSDSVSRTAGAVEQMSRAFEGVAQGALEQSAAVSRASAITNEISTVIRQVSTQAQAQEHESAESVRTTRDSARTVEETIRAMQVIQAKVGQSAAKVQEMGSRSEQISTIVETIDDIAGQTNLLALNAAIEAARAGEHGKGFSVVADEVRKLAEKSAAATKEIAGLIKSIQVTVNEAVLAMNESAQKVEQGVALANQSVEALAGITQAADFGQKSGVEIARAAEKMNSLAGDLVQAMQQVSGVVEANTASTREMSLGSSSVTAAIENIASVSEENSAAVEEVGASAEEMSAQAEEVTASAQSLAEMAKDLQLLVGQFKLREDAAVEVPSAEPLYEQPEIRPHSNGKKPQPAAVA